MKLRLNNISKSYGNVQILKQISFDLTPGIYGLLGANGSGKTTLFRIICDLLKADSGQVLFNGRDIKDQAEEFRSILGYLPQEYCLIFLFLTLPRPTKSNSSIHLFGA